MNWRKLALVGSETAATAASIAAWLRTASERVKLRAAAGSATPRSTMRGSAASFGPVTVGVTGAPDPTRAIADVDIEPSTTAAARATAVRLAGAWPPARISLRMGSTLLFEKTLY